MIDMYLTEDQAKIMESKRRPILDFMRAMLAIGVEVSVRDHYSYEPFSTMELLTITSDEQRRRIIRQLETAERHDQILRAEQAKLDAEE